MLVSDQLWNHFVKSHPEFGLWKTWLNKYAENGVLIDTDDNTSFINPEKNQAVKIMFEPESDSVFEYWISEFGDEEMGYIDVLNCVFNDIEYAQKPFAARLEKWVKKQV